jgi:cyclohexyl-isocyanide hydratase
LSDFPDGTPDAGRVAHDGKYWTSVGVTSGIDIALSALAEVVDGDFAQPVQLTVEYAPAPPFEAGRPESAPAHVLKLVKERLAENGNARLEAVLHAASLLAGQHSSVLDNQLSTYAGDVVASTAQTPHQR